MLGKVHYKLTNGTSRQTCTAYQDRPTSHNQTMYSNILLPEKQNKTKNRIIVNMDFSVTCTPRICTASIGKKKKGDRKFNCKKDNSPEVEDNDKLYEPK